MNKLVRAGLEAITAIVITLAIVIGAFSAIFGMDMLIALSGPYYYVWAAIIVAMHLAFAQKRRHLRLGLGVAAGVVVMGVHLAMFLSANIYVEMNLVPVILHDFGFALVAMIALNLVHLVIFRRRVPAESASAAPLLSEGVNDTPASESASRTDQEVAGGQAGKHEPEQAKRA